MFNIKRQPTENEWQYLWRLGQAKESGLIDSSWQDLADLINKEFHTGDERTESVYRKNYATACRFFEAGVFGNFTDKEYLDEITVQRQELEKQMVKTRDERTEYRRLIREEARKESYRDQLLRSISEHETFPLEYNPNRREFETKFDRNNDLIISCTDIHAGIEIDNFFNKFNGDVLKERFQKYLDKILVVQGLHNSENSHVILSEMISGLIHDTLRIESNQNIIEQFLMVMDYISQFLAEMSYHFKNVYVYVCPGNHSRIFQDKDKGMKGENMDHLAIPFLEAKLQNYVNVVFKKNEIEESIAMFSVRGQKVFASHGDKDSPENVVQKFTLMFGMRPDIVYLGHRHTNGMSTVYDVKVVQSGCLSGSDSYCMDKRLKNRPEQTISVVSEDGLECLYDVKF